MERPNLGNDDLQKLMDAAASPATDVKALPLLLDVRTEEEYVGLGHVPGARLIPIQELMARIGELDPAQPTVVICEHGVRSDAASRYLLQQGFQDVSHLATGMAAWPGERAFDFPTAPTPQA